MTSKGLDSLKGGDGTCESNKQVTLVEAREVVPWTLTEQSIQVATVTFAAQTYVDGAGRIHFADAGFVQFAYTYVTWLLIQPTL